MLLTMKPTSSIWAQIIILGAFSFISFEKIILPKPSQTTLSLCAFSSSNSIFLTSPSLDAIPSASDSFFRNSKFICYPPRLFFNLCMNSSYDCDSLNLLTAFSSSIIMLIFFVISLCNSRFPFIKETINIIFGLRSSYSISVCTRPTDIKFLFPVISIGCGIVTPFVYMVFKKLSRSQTSFG